ncbi:DUF2809 domain-containing protein [Actinocorallia aurantiaca]|jgi:hypothetical protein|uniref:DUF2809 domain-containing protein n=1 Tax=Actinocorallia aurantiaca TaxID=46204 RepID=A0ABN3UBJ2_9ACTN
MDMLRFRLVVVAGAVATLAVGLGITLVGFGKAGEYAGGVLYACLVGLLILLVLPRLRPVPFVLATAGLCWAVEFFQLTPWPAEWAERSFLSRLVFGTTFNAPDLLPYVLGAILVGGIHAVIRPGFPVPA